MHAGASIVDFHIVNCRAGLTWLGWLDPVSVMLMVRLPLKAGGLGDVVGSALE